MGRRSLAWAVLSALWALPLHAQPVGPDAALHAEAGVSSDEGVEGATEITGEVGDSALDHFWLGAYFRHLWIPGYMTQPFFDRAPSIVNNGFGLEGTYRTSGGLNFVFGVGYMPYEFTGEFLADGQDIEDTELVRSDLSLLHLTGSMLWEIEFHRSVALELGFGLDLGVFLGEVRRDEAFLNPATSRFERCSGPLMPAELGPNGVPYCNVPENGSGVSDDPSDTGEHYDVVEDRVPPVMLFPMLPHLALRIQPLEHLMLKAEAAFGVVQIWLGLSLHGSFGMFESGPSEMFVEPDRAAEVTPGRVLGRAVEAGTDAPVAGATVRLSARALSPLTTQDDGRFVVDRLDPGTVTFQVEHPDYETGECSAEIPPEGGDVPLICHLTRREQVGAISGRVKNQAGKPVSTTVELSGPRSATLTTNDEGVFAATDLPVGRYRLRVDADGYLLQVVEVEVEPDQTAMPQVVLSAKPKRSLVKLQQKEIVITQQVRFASGSAQIEPQSDALLAEVADVMLRNQQVRRVEIQGHTDNTGSHELNMRLSQERANAVRDRLIAHGVDPERLVAKGYGPDHPIRTNRTAAGRAKNRRVQFIILEQDPAAAGAPAGSAD